MQQRALGQGHVNEVVEAVVEQDLGVEDHDHVDPDEHLEHAFVQIEVDRPRRLRRGAGPIEEGVVAFAPDRELHLERAVAAAVVVDIVLERLRLLGQVLHDQLAHGAIGALEQRLAGLLVGVAAEAVADLDHALLTGAAAGDDRHEIAVVHLRRARVVHDEVEHRLVELAALVEQQRRNADALAEDRGRVRRHAARHPAADVHQMAEHRGEADQLALVKHRHQHHPVVDVADGAAAFVRIALQDDVAGLQVELVLGEHLVHVGAELADDHPPLGIGDHRELVVLFADHRRHGGAEQHRIHLVAGVAQRVLDEIERDRIKPAAFARRRSSRLAGAAWHRSDARRRDAPPPGLARAPRPQPRRRTSRRSCAAPLRREPQGGALVAIRARRAELHLRGAVDRELAEHGHRAALGLVFDDFGRPARAETAVEHRVEIGSLAARLRSQARRVQIRRRGRPVRGADQTQFLRLRRKDEIELLLVGLEQVVERYVGAQRA